MTILAAAMSILLTTTLSIFIADAGRASQRRAHAQTAADAAALAALAEQLPFGTNSPEVLADRYARANGAELIGCVCRAGSYRIEVEVAYEGLRARAAAALDPSLLRVASAAPADGLHPQVAAALDSLLAASGGRVYLVSGYRSTERQAELWAEALARYGSAEAARRWVAPPGSSMHEAGLAIDLGGDLEYAAQLVTELGLPLYRPLDHEPWHFELAGSRS